MAAKDVKMAAKDVKMATDNLSCPVCHLLFKNPKYLPCHHSYCEHCLEKLKMQSKIICPECREESTLPPGGVKDLDNNDFIEKLVKDFVLKNMVEIEANEKCDECSMDDPVVAFCTDCSVYLCHVCNEYHKRSKRLHGHGIIPLAELRSKKDVAIQPQPKAMMCKEHDIELLFYCETCDQLVCMYCTVKDHNGHNHDTVKKMAPKHREELKRITAPVEEMIRGLSDTHNNIKKMRKEIEQQGEEVNKKIDQHYDRVIQQVVEQKEQLKLQVHNTVSQKVKVITTQLNEVEDAQEEVLSIKELNNTVEMSSDQEMLSIKKNVVDRMEEIAGKYRKVNLPPIQQATIEFVPVNNPLSSFGVLCSTATPDPYNCEVIDPPTARYYLNGKKVEFTIITKDMNKDRCIGGGQVVVQFGGVSNTVQLKDNKDGSYTASFVPQQVGEVELTISINGEQIMRSPYRVMVINDYKSLSKPSKIINCCSRPLATAVGNGGIWAVANTNNCVSIYDGENQMVMKHGGDNVSSIQFNWPSGVGFDSDNRLYVVDRCNHRVLKFTADGKYSMKFGSKGSGDGELKSPRRLAVYNCKVYVADCGNKRISVFCTNGKFHCTIGSGQLANPYDVAVDGSNQLLIADNADHCIYIFTLDGNYVGMFGAYGTGEGELKHPYGLDIDVHGSIFIADTYNHRVSIFNKHFEFLYCFGSEGSDIGKFQRPCAINVTESGKVYVSDHMNKMIQIY